MNDSDKINYILSKVEKIDERQREDSIKIDRLEQAAIREKETRDSTRNWALGALGGAFVAIVGVGAQYVSGLWKGG